MMVDNCFFMIIENKEFSNLSETLGIEFFGDFSKISYPRFDSGL